MCDRVWWVCENFRGLMEMLRRKGTSLFKVQQNRVECRLENVFVFRPMGGVLNLVICICFLTCLEWTKSSYLQTGFSHIVTCALCFLGSFLIGLTFDIHDMNELALRNDVCCSWAGIRGFPDLSPGCPRDENL
jgi:hypothetical protein